MIQQVHDINMVIWDGGNLNIDIKSIISINLISHKYIWSWLMHVIDCAFTPNTNLKIDYFRLST